jgi:hypothetical protein
MQRYTNRGNVVSEMIKAATQGSKKLAVFQEKMSHLYNKKAPVVAGAFVIKWSVDQALPPKPPEPPPSQSQKPRTGFAAREAFENNVIQPSSVIPA